MKIYAVGGSVRDELLQRPVKDRDFVVVGSSPSEMLSLGYKQVGIDFPVFLNKAGEEYALARTERKSGHGYNGFEVNADSTVTLEDDLRRRDLTINAMAKDLETGEIIDPFNGLMDLQEKTLRHVSPAFAEDPLRVLRVARFRARYNFKLAHETFELMTQLVQKGEIDHLTPERVWLELEKGLSEPNPVLFIVTLMTVEAWGKLFPNVRVGGTFHLLSAKDAKELSFNAKLMMMFSETPEAEVIKVLEQYKASADTVRVLTIFKQIQAAKKRNITSEEMLDLLKQIDAFRRPQDFEAVMEPVNSAAVSDDFAMFLSLISAALNVASEVTFADLTPEQQTLKGAAVGEAIDDARLEALEEIFE